MIPTSLHAEKATFRKTLRSGRDSLPAVLRKLYSQRIIGQLLHHPLFLHSQSPGLYCSYGSEVETLPLLEYQINRNGFVCLPRLFDNNRIEFFRVEGSPQDLIPSKLGILEPNPGRHPLIEPSAMDLFVVPGIGFDPYGQRIGQGLGCYDHYFSRIGPEVPCIGLGFEGMMVERLPTEPTDRSMNLVISEAGVYRYAHRVWTTTGFEQTHALAADFARWVRPPLVLRLSGELGAGKTEWARGFLHTLGWNGRVRSPTFSLENVYEFDSMRIYHLDGYRLVSPSQLDRDRLCEIQADPEAIVFVEWPERFGNEIPFTSPILSFQRVDDTTRTITCETFLEKDLWKAT